MVFANLIFLFIFLPLNIILYFVSGNRNYRNLVLVAFSLFFYAWGEPVWVVMLIATTFLDYMHGRLIDQFRGTKWAKVSLICSLVFDLGMLGLFKYSGFLVENLNVLLRTSIPVPSFVMPIGISFYTFQTISYVVDVYRGKVAPQKSYLKYLMYVSLYFQLVAGPIVRYSDVEDEINNRVTDFRDVSSGITRFCVGLAKKVVVANAAGQLVAQYMDIDPSRMTVLGSWFGILMFTLQIYYDFSAYSDMAIGLGQMFGFHFLENFNYPYISRSVTEFWRRWHMSLSSFFRDYVYIPLGGNRRRPYFNLFVVWFLTGLWHGASWNFILWGLYFGVLIALERLFLGDFLKKLPRFASHIYMFFVVVIGWVLFYFTDISSVGSYLKVMFGFGGVPFSSIELSIVVVNNIFWIVLSALFCLPIVQLFKYAVNRLSDEKRRIILWLQPVFNVLILVVCTALLVGQSYNPFLYFRF